VWSAQLSQIYPELGRLHEAGLVRVVETGPRGRKVYEITDEGLAEVRRWLVETEPDRAQRNGAMLRTFFLWLLEPAEAEAYLRREAALHRENLRRFEEMAEADPVTPSASLPVEWAIRYCRGLAEWSEWAADVVRAQALQRA
jgi:DNA-binding PadR family transcriptional regulator